MRIANPFSWEVPNLAALPAPSISLPRLTFRSTVLLLTAIASVLVDILNTVTNYVNLHSPVVAALKGVILLVLVASIRSTYSYLAIASLGCIFLLRELWINIESQALYPVDDVTFFLRILLFAAWVLALHENRDDRTLLRYILQLFVIVTCINVLCQLAGAAFGLNIFAAYAGSGRGGYKGMFAAGNDASVFYILAMIYSAYLWKRGKRHFLVVVLIGATLLAIGSKTAVLGIILVPVVYFGFRKGMGNIINPLYLLRLRKRTLLLLTASGIAAVVVTIFSWGYISETIGGADFGQASRVYRESGLLSTLTSFRDVKVQAYFQSIRSVPDVLLGLQIESQYVGSWADVPGNFMYEVDLFDYLGRVGLLGLIITLSIITRVTGLLKWRRLSPELKTLIVMIAICSGTVGHTLVSSSNAAWIAFWLIAYTSLMKNNYGQNQFLSLAVQGI